MAVLLASLMVLGLTACGQGAASSAAPAAESKAEESKAEEKSEAGGDLKVGVFYYAFSDTYISTVRTALDAELNAAGITFQNFDGNNNQTTQNEQIDTAITDGYNLLIVNMVTSGSSDVANEIISKANGIPVIFFNRAIEAEGEEGSVLNANASIAFIGTDAPAAGHLQGKMVGDYLVENYDKVDLNGDGVISYALFKGDEANVEAIYRSQYGVEDANAVLKAAGKPEMTYFDASNSAGYQVDLQGTWSAQAALDYMNTNLSQYNEANGNMIELIICNNDNMAEGSISALEQAGYNTGDSSATTIPVFGVDATDAAKDLIAAGKMIGTVKQDAEGMAKAVAEVAQAAGAGTAPAEAVAKVAGSADMFSVAEGVANKLYVAYAPYTGE